MGAPSTVVPAGTPPPTSSITPWLVGPAVVSQAGGSNYFDGNLAISHVLGASVTDPVVVKLFDTGCINEESDPTAVVSTLATSQSGISYSYQVSIDQSKIGDDATGSATYVKCAPGANSACSVGNIQFCTRVSTYHGSIEVAFVETNFDLAFNLTDNDFNLGSIGITENQPDSFITDVDTDFTVDACQCADHACVAPETIEQDTSLVMCLYAEHPTPGMASNVRISNFNIDVQDAAGASNFVYQPVTFGTNQWVTDGLTVVDVGTNDYVMITTPIVAQFFIQNVASIDVTGNAFLEFKSQKEGRQVFAEYGMVIGLGAGVGVDLGCFANLVAQIRALM